MIRSGDKRLLNMMILEILQQYTDQNHRLGQSEILSLLQENYGVTCSRKTLYNNLQALREAGYEISTDGAAGGTCLLSRTLEDPELYMLIDSVLFSRTLSHREAGNLIKKLEAMGSPSFHKNTAHVCSLPYLQHSDNEQVIKNIDVISQAITKHRKIRFVYSSYGTDFRLHPRKAEPVLFTPYQIAADNGRFYLIGNVDRYGDVSHYRVDRMSKVEELKDPAKPIREVEGLENEWTVPAKAHGRAPVHVLGFIGPCRAGCSREHDGRTR